MQSYPRVFLLILIPLCDLAGLTAAQPDAPARPNVVLSTAVHFTGPDGRDVTVVPGRYFVEQAGATALRLTPMGEGKSFMIQAQSLRHEQYELFSPIALTRPGMKGEMHIALLDPGGHKLEAVGSLIEPSRAQERVQPRKGPPPERPATTPPAVTHQPSSPSIIYVPPKTRAPGERVAGGSRRISQGLLDLWTLCPDHTGLTAQEQPTLYWYISQPLKTPVDIRLIEPGAPRPYFEARLVPPMDAGFQSINLADYGIRLSPEVPYQWFVSLTDAEAGKEVTIGGAIMLVPLEGSLSAELVRAEKGEIPRLYARAGLWYDAFSALSDLIKSDPDNTVFLGQRLSLLEQVGVTEAALLMRGARQP